MAYNRIFLSHKGVDKGIVIQYRDVLAAAGFHPWLDESELRASSAPLVRALDAGMEDSCAAVFFVTPHYIDEGFLNYEVNCALQQKIERENGFTIITLVINDDNLNAGKVPAPLKKYVWKDIKNHLEGIRFILESLPCHLSKIQQFIALPDFIPPAAREIALVGQNLTGRLGVDHSKYLQFLKELKVLLSRDRLENLALMMMTPKALNPIHPKSAVHLRAFTLPRLRDLSGDVGGDSRITVTFHPASTLSMTAVDWTYPDSTFALVTPKLQITAGMYNRVSFLLDERYFDAGSLTRMLLDGKEKANGAIEVPLMESPSVLEKMLDQEGL